MTYYGSVGKIAFRSQDLTGTQATTLISLPSVIIFFLLLSNNSQQTNFWNAPISLFMTINLATGSCSFYGGGTFGGAFFMYPATVSYGSDWVFDSYTEISICSGSDVASPIGCTVQNLKASYTYFPLSGYLNLANSGKDIFFLSFH